MEHALCTLRQRTLEQWRPSIDCETLKMTGMKKESEISSSMSNKDFIYAYGWNRVLMHIIGGWPEPDENFFMKYRIYINAVLLTILIVIPQIASIQVFFGNLGAVIECLSVILAVDISLLKLIWLGAQRPTVQRLLNLMAEDWLLHYVPEEQEEMMKIAGIIRKISSCSFYGSICMFIPYVLGQIMLGLQQKDDPTVDSRLSIGFLYTTIFPFDTTSIIVFLPLWIGQFFMTYISMVGYSSAYSFLAMLIFHQCGQFKVLRRRLERIVDEEMMNDRKKFWQKLGEIVERHEHLNERISEIEENFNKMFLIIILVFIFITCTQSFSTLMMLQSSDDGFPIVQIIFFIIFTSYDLGHFFVYCWAGDTLINESSSLGISLYNSEWYNLSTNEAKSVLIVNNRCTVPQKITGGKFAIFALPTFTSVVKTAGSYLSVLLAMKSS